ncbi:MAG: nickel-dependent lactate racemase [candidate division KSB1 bacterium]|nr:nickel-dependent lactate racemase [candidate division KSB1 bacterium]
MRIPLLYDKTTIEINVPDDATVLRTTYPPPSATAAELVLQACKRPIAGPTLSEALSRRRKGEVVIVVSDVTRPIPYSSFLPQLLNRLHEEGASKEEICLLIATGMHRPSTSEERSAMFGEDIAGNYRILDHDASADDLVQLPAKSRSGASIRLNRRFVQAGFRLITGLVEPHYMAGFSGGRKAVCPGLASLETLQRFHGYAMLADPHSTAARLDDNPCHLEALSVAQAAGVDFSINVVLNEARRVVAAFAGELDAAHRQACRFVEAHAAPKVKEHDVVVTCSAGYPLDTTFYQCTKSFVCALPAVKPQGVVLTVGGCREGIGSREYQEILFRYADDWRQFLSDIAATDRVIKDQWQHQMHTRALAKIGRENILFFTDALPQEVLEKLSVNGRAVTSVAAALQAEIDRLAAEKRSFCVIPEGPYCTPVPAA